MLTDDDLLLTPHSVASEPVSMEDLNICLVTIPIQKRETCNAGQVLRELPLGSRTLPVSVP